MWQQGLGVRVRLVNQELKGMLEARRTGDYQILRWSWTADYEDPANFLDLWTSESGNNYTGWSNPDYDALLVAAARTVDEAARNVLYGKAEAILLEESPVIPIYFYTHVYLRRPSLKGWYPTVLDHHPYKALYLESED